MAIETPAAADDDTDVDVVVVGSINLDLVVRVQRLPGPGETLSGSSFAEFAGGKGLNQAVAAARAGARVAMIACVGDDDAGRSLRALIRSEGIDDRLVRTVGGPTGRAVIAVDDAAENTIVVVAGANALVEVGELPKCSVVLAQLETTHDAVRTAFRDGRSGGAFTVLNPAPAVALDDDLLRLCSAVIPNEHEVALLGGAAHLSSLAEHVVVTLGAAGADHWTAGERHRIEPFAVDPIDTTGAGDAYCGHFAARLALGDDMSTALRAAAAAGALATTVPGAVPSQPTARQVRALVDGQQP